MLPAPVVPASERIIGTTRSCATVAARLAGTGAAAVLTGTRQARPSRLSNASAFSGPPLPAR